jgi:hypothetical protein
MHHRVLVALISALGVLGAPAIASATVTYNFSVPLKVTGLTASGTYQVACAVGTTNPASITPPTSFGGPINGGSTSQTQTVTVTSSTVQHSYVCALFQANGNGPNGPMWMLNPPGASISGSM